MSCMHQALEMCVMYRMNDKQRMDQYAPYELVYLLPREGIGWGEVWIHNSVVSVVSALCTRNISHIVVIELFSISFFSPLVCF